MLKLIIATFILFTINITLTTAYAEDTTIRMIAASDVIQGLDQAIADVKSQTSLPVTFPSYVPALQNALYASYSSYSMNPNYQKFWQISADTTPECKGVRLCNVGVITAEKGRHIDPTYDNSPEQKKLPKEKVKLRNGITAYYTPTHLETTRIYPTIEWQSNGVLYTMRWKMLDKSEEAAKQTLIDMANSTF